MYWRDPGEFGDFERATRAKKVPVVLSPEEMRRVLAGLTDAAHPLAPPAKPKTLLNTLGENHGSVFHRHTAALLCSLCVSGLFDAPGDFAQLHPGHFGKNSFEAFPSLLAVGVNPSVVFALFASGAGPVAQRLEQGTHNPLVPGSNPGGPTALRIAECGMRI